MPPDRDYHQYAPRDTNDSTTLKFIVRCWTADLAQICDMNLHMLIQLVGFFELITILCMHESLDRDYYLTPIDAKASTTGFQIRYPQKHNAERPSTPIWANKEPMKYTLSYIASIHTLALCNYMNWIMNIDLLTFHRAQ